MNVDTHAESHVAKHIRRSLLGWPLPPLTTLPWKLCGPIFELRPRCYMCQGSLKSGSHGDAAIHHCQMEDGTVRAVCYSCYAFVHNTQ